MNADATATLRVKTFLLNHNHEEAFCAFPSSLITPTTEIRIVNGQHVPIDDFITIRHYVHHVFCKRPLKKFGQTLNNENKADSARRDTVTSFVAKAWDLVPYLALATSFADVAKLIQEEEVIARGKTYGDVFSYFAVLIRNFLVPEHLRGVSVCVHSSFFTTADPQQQANITNSGLYFIRIPSCAGILRFLIISNNATNELLL